MKRLRRDRAGDHDGVPAPEEVGDERARVAQVAPGLARHRGEALPEAHDRLDAGRLRHGIATRDAILERLHGPHRLVGRQGIRGFRGMTGEHHGQSGN